MKIDKSKWERKTLREICICAGIYGASSPSIDRDLSRPRYIRITDIDDWGKLNDDYVVSANKEDDEKYSLVYGDILFARTGATVGKTYLYESLEPQIYAGYLIRFRLNTDIVNSKYVFLYSKSSTYKSWLKCQMIGAAQPNINAKKYSSLILPIPSLNIQQSIATELDTLQSLITEYREQLNEYDKLAQSIFHEMFGDVVTNEKNWNCSTLNKISEVRDGTHDSPKYVKIGIPLITTKNIVNGSIDFSSAKLISADDANKINIRSMVEDQDIIMPMIGTIGGAIIINKDREFCIKNVALFKKKTPVLIEQIYLMYLLNSKSMLKHFQDKSKGVSQKFVSLKIFRSLNIPLPPLPLQQQFASRIESIEAQKALIKQQLSDVQTLFDSRMQYYFD